MNREPTDSSFYRFERNTRLRPHDFREPQSSRGDLAVAVLGIVGLVLLGIVLRFNFF